MAESAETTPASAPAPAAPPPAEEGAAEAKPVSKGQALKAKLASLKGKIKLPAFLKKPRTGTAVPDYEEGFGARFRAGLLYLVRGLWSRDIPTLLSTWLFWISLVAFATVGTVGVRTFVHWYKNRGPSEQELVARAFIEREKRRTEIAAVAERSYLIGGFTLELVEPKDSKGVQKLASGLMNVAELEIVLECDSPDTCKLVELQAQKAKDQVTLALTPLSREDLLTGEGKKKIKRAIIDRMNGWLTQGRVVNVFFAKVLVM